MPKRKNAFNDRIIKCRVSGRSIRNSLQIRAACAHRPHTSTHLKRTSNEFEHFMSLTNFELYFNHLIITLNDF